MAISEVGFDYKGVAECSSLRTDPPSLLAKAMMDTVRKVEGRTTEKSAENPHFFQFPEDSSIVLSNGRAVDISLIQMNLYDIFVGGINYGGGGSKMMARAMEAIGNCQPVYNLPVSYEGAIYPDFCRMEMVSTEDSVVPAETVRDMIDSNLKEGYTHFNIPITLNGHASLVSMIIVGGKATFRFYDSLAPEVISYEDRYSPALIAHLKTLLPEGVELEAKEKADVLHILDQGGKSSAGCGYYSVYTALLLKEHEEIRALTSFEGAPLLRDIHDKGIRAELAVRTLLSYGLEKVDLSFRALCQQRRDGIFSRIKDGLPHLIKQLESRITVL